MQFLKKDKLFEVHSEEKLCLLSDYFPTINRELLHDNVIILKATKTIDDFKSDTIDTFYKEIESCNFKELEKLFVFCSSCSFSNAEVERGFSVGGNILTKK
jgi:hypothetical protein